MDRSFGALALSPLDMMGNGETDTGSVETWNQYRKLVLSELERLNRTIKDETGLMRQMVDGKIMELRTDSIAVLREELTRSQLDRLQIWEEIRKQQVTIVQWRSGIGIVTFLIGSLISAFATFVVTHLWNK